MQWILSQMLQFGVPAVVYVDEAVVVEVLNFVVALVDWVVVGPCCVWKPETFLPIGLPLKLLT